MVLTFYYDLLSQPCRAVYLLCKATGVDFKAEELELFKGDLYKPEMLKKNPNHKVPFIEDDGFGLSESVAIMSYIANKNKNKVKDHWFPRANVQQQAKFEEFMNWQQMGIRKPCVDVFLNTLRSRLTIGPLTKQPLNKEVVDKAKENLKNTIKQLDEYFLKDKLFITGNEISAADILGVAELYQLRGCEEEGLYMSNKKVAAWMQRVEDRLAPHFAKACEKINGVREQFKQAK